MSSYQHHASSGPCHRCGRAGHLARECSLHICFRCNGRGHMAWACVEGVTCSRCGEKGHLQRNCKNVSCHKCGRRGHISKFCNDPFMKAEEVEKHEQQQAFLKSKVASGRAGEVAGLTTDEAVSTSSAARSDAPGPWDGLGNRDHRKVSAIHSSSVGIAVGSASESGSEGTAIGKVRILSIKRKLCPDASLGRTKKRADDNLGDMRLSGEAVEATTQDVSDSKPSQWNGLLGYGSEDSRDSHPPCDVGN